MRAHFPPDAGGKVRILIFHWLPALNSCYVTPATVPGPGEMAVAVQRHTRALKAMHAVQGHSSKAYVLTDCGTPGPKQPLHDEHPENSTADP
jgi:hypothetical protein